MMDTQRTVVVVIAGWVLGGLALVAGLVLLAIVGVYGPDLEQGSADTPGLAISGISLDELRQLGLGSLPEVRMPPDNPLSADKVELGKMLFFDRRMSGNNLVSCATCHAPKKGWGDGNELSLGYPGTLHWRNSQTIINSAYLQKLFWAGESLSLEKQAKSAFTGNLAGNLDSAMAEERLRQIPDYVNRFKDVFGADAPSFDDALRAVAAFEATITSRNVPYDRYMEGDEGALTDSALRGLALFTDKANCLACHSGPLLTDESFHDLDVPQNPAFEDDSLRQIALRYQHRTRGVPESIYREADTDLGLYYTTKQDIDKGKFRTAPLREVGQTGPYMHNGTLQTLTEVVEFYNKGGGTSLTKSPVLRPLGLSEQEVADIVSFLEALTGDEILIDTPPMPEYEVMP